MSEEYFEETQEEPKPVDYLSICAIATAYENSLTIDKVMFAMTGDLESAAVLSRLRYWFSPGKNGKQRTRIRKDGDVWMARKDEDWLDEACVTKKQMARVKKFLLKKGLVKIKTYKFDGNPTSHWSLNKQKFTELYNEALQKMISISPNGVKGNTPKGEKETPHSGISINKHISQASYSSDLEKHMEDDFLKKDLDKDENLDELGNIIFIPPRLKGKALAEYNQLSREEQGSYSLLMNVPPANTEDVRFNQLVAIRMAYNVTPDRVRKAIMVYKQRLEAGEQVGKMGGYLTKILMSDEEPLPPHAEDNKRFWHEKRRNFPDGSYRHDKHGIVFDRIDKGVYWTMSPEIFKDQLKRCWDELSGNV